ncbi:flagellar hook-length control protein FliK [Thermoleophilum album]|jgi:flagellar hook-length control protein FliK|uniref:flagellar hook-length control protein FliK n=1 Tax=Thermoleophilum album TaxID=29539 RepID=UPI00237CAA7D|nr:flagellar hook-length control protein FliK [Thermoleophilum album]WDT94567.1 flagellar hook-length control protein FliK [Thermoleophilum album]
MTPPSRIDCAQRAAVPETLARIRSPRGTPPPDPGGGFELLLRAWTATAGGPTDEATGRERVRGAADEVVARGAPASVPDDTAAPPSGGSAGRALDAKGVGEPSGANVCAQQDPSCATAVPTPAGPTPTAAGTPVQPAELALAAPTFDSAGGLVGDPATVGSGKELSGAPTIGAAGVADTVVAGALVDGTERAVLSAVPAVAETAVAQEAGREPSVSAVAQAEAKGATAHQPASGDQSARTRQASAGLRTDTAAAALARGDAAAQATGDGGPAASPAGAARAEGHALADGSAGPGGSVPPVATTGTSGASGAQAGQAAVAAQPATSPLPRSDGAPTHAPAQLAEAAETAVVVLAARGAHHARVRLRPPALGEIEVRIREHAGVLSVRISAADEHSAQTLAAAADQIRRALERSDLVVARVEVEAAARAADNAAGGFRERDNEPGSNSASHPHSGNRSEVAAGPEPVPGNAKAVVLVRGLVIDVLA